MLDSIIEMVKGRNEEIFAAFPDMGNAYDRVNRKKLFEVMRCYGVHEKLLRQTFTTSSGNSCQLNTCVSFFKRMAA